jgi:hypothetical protein
MHAIDHRADEPASKALVAICGSIILLWIGAGAAYPDVLQQSLVGFSAPVLLFLICAVAPLRTFQPKEYKLYLLWSGLFVSVGLLYGILSFWTLFSDFTDLPLRHNYILRQTYFLFLWLPFAIGSYSIWSCLLSSLVGFVRRWGLIFLLVASAADLLTSTFLADPINIQRVGYAFFFEKFSFAYFFILVFSLYSIVIARTGSAFVLLLTYFALSRVTNYGIMFNALTGYVMVGILAVGAIPILSPLVRARAILLIYAAVLLGCIFGVLFPEYSGGGDNLWRATAWRANLVSLGESNLVGVGFGTPYHPLTADNLFNALLNRFPEPIEPQYFRTQHSSIVNMFYRLGVVGGSLFVWLNGLVVCAAYHAIKNGVSAEMRTLNLASLAVLITQLFQGTVHVGIETPRYLVVYMLAVGLVFATVAAFRRQELQRTRAGVTDAYRDGRQWKARRFGLGTAIP